MKAANQKDNGGPQQRRRTVNNRGARENGKDERTDGSFKHKPRCANVLLLLLCSSLFFSHLHIAKAPLHAELNNIYLTPQQRQMKVTPRHGVKITLLIFLYGERICLVQ